METLSFPKEPTKKALETAKEKGRDDYRDFFVLCQRCRIQHFAEQLVGEQARKGRADQTCGQAKAQEIMPCKDGYQAWDNSLQKLMFYL